MPGNLTKPQISIDMFCKLLQKLTPAELAQLPSNKLPRHIPEEVIKTASPEMRKLLEDLVVSLEIDRVDQQVQDMDKYGQTLANALQKAETPKRPDSHKLLAKYLTELANLLHAWRGDSALETQTRAKVSFEALVGRLATAAELIDDLRGELAAFNRAEYLISTEGRKAGIHRGRLTDAVAQLREKTEPALQQMAQFNTLRLTLCQQEMDNLHNGLIKEDANQLDLQSHLNQLHKDLKNQQSAWRKALAKYRNNEDHSRIQKQISQLLATKNAAEVIVPENALQRWLDAVVDACLDVYSHQLCSKQLPEARSRLYWLLRRYSQQQENNARQIAKNPFTQVNPQLAIEYMLLSEKFILEYFVHKQQDDPFWFGSAIHERRQELDHLRDEILHELKANIDKGTQPFPAYKEETGPEASQH